MRLTDPTPGGLEAVDDRPFAFPGWENTPGSTALAWAARSIYDDRSVFYLEQLPAGETVIRYQLRALASGDYQARHHTWKPARAASWARAAPNGCGWSSSGQGPRLAGSFVAWRRYSSSRSTP
ncbi:hypothetical protein [Deinococcus radiophilus]|uniref:alpha-2-macroglobulin family protein n=1 Tax=Deinococcus radiophilus TaxID=32062 RepID=UPI00361D0FCC